jgi:hypothetical protein
MREINGKKKEKKCTPSVPNYKILFDKIVLFF